MFCAITILSIVLVDQLSKWLVVEKLNETVTVIPHVLSFQYATNTGMAWGMLKDHRWVFMSLSVVALLGFTYLYYQVKNPHKLFTLSMGFIIGGGVGNMIDRIFRENGGVVDFFRTDFMDFPIFNVADIFITVGGFLLVIYFFFYDKKLEYPIAYMLDKKEEKHE